MNEAAPIVFPEELQAEPEFIPVSRTDIISVILAAGQWSSDNERALAESVLYKIGSLRQHQSGIMLNELSDLYDIFNPDDETVNIGEVTLGEKLERRHEFSQRVKDLVTSANYRELSEEELADILTKMSPDGVRVEVDFSEFDMKLLFYRGEEDQKRSKGDIRWAFLRRVHYEVPIYKRLFMAIKFKAEEERIAELMQEHNISEQKARKKLKQIRSVIPPYVSTDHIYLKIFKEIPQHDVEMLFPNIRVKMKYRDKLQLGGSALLGTITWALGTATKLLVTAILTPPMLALALISGFGGIMWAQIRNFFVTRDRYRMQLAQSLYFQNLANNQGALAVMVDDAEEEDVKEEILLFAHLRGHTVNYSQLEGVKENINAFLHANFGVDVQFDIYDALQRLIANGLVTQSHEGDLRTLSLTEANTHLFVRWCRALES
ncbi:MAG: DUF3754 domain-containing protein [Alphaproteobacteria bacterium]